MCTVISYTFYPWNIPSKPSPYDPSLTIPTISACKVQASEICCMQLCMHMKPLISCQWVTSQSLVLLITPTSLWVLQYNTMMMAYRYSTHKYSTHTFYTGTPYTNILHRYSTDAPHILHTYILHTYTLHTHNLHTYFIHIIDTQISCTVILHRCSTYI